MSDGQLGPFNWPSPMRVCRNETPEQAFEFLRGQHREAWAKCWSLKRLLADHWPEAWDAISRCRTRMEVQESQQAGLSRVCLASPRQHPDHPVFDCGSWPFCPACNSSKGFKRYMAAMKKIASTTPSGENLSCYQVTLTVSEMEPGGLATHIANRPIAEFRDAAIGLLHRMYGDRVGVLMVYQDYGERLLVKQHPHVHAIVHGWRPATTGDRMQKTPQYDLRGLRKEALMRKWRAELERVYPEAFSRGLEWPMNGHDVDVRYHPQTRDVAHAVKYATRELVDFRKFSYRSSSQRVRVLNYRKPDEAVTTTPDAIKTALSAYVARTGVTYRGRKAIEACYGALAASKINDVVRLAGREEIHEDECFCRECVSWARMSEGPLRGRDLRVD